MNKPKIIRQITPEDIFSDAISFYSDSLTSGDMRLLVSGLAALRSAREQPLSKTELRAVWGMIDYVAYAQDLSKDRVTLIVCSTFGVSAVKALPSRLYNDVIEYLVDFQIHTVVN